MKGPHLNFSETVDEESNRLKDLLELNILDTPPEGYFDEITKFAAEAFEVPTALVSFVDQNRQWFKSKQGLEVNETPRSVSFCTHAIHADDIFEIPDAAQDERFCKNPLVLGEPNIRFYAGWPLRLPNRPLGLGTLCIIDSKPRTLNQTQRSLLGILGRYIVNHLELERKRQEIANFAQAVGRHNKTLDELNHKLYNASRLSDIGQMSANLCHEIKNPMTIIIGRSQQMLGRLEKDEELSKETIVKSLGTILSTSKRVINIVDSIKSLTRDDYDEKPDFVKFDEIFGHIEAICAEKFKYQAITFDIIKPDRVAEVCCNPTQVEIAIINLLNNSCDAIADLEEKWLQMRYVETKDGVELAIVDSGRGIAPEIADKIMEPFFTTKPRGKGTGLGLNLARRVVNKMGGQLRLDRTAENTTFVFSFPSSVIRPSAEPVS